MDLIQRVNTKVDPFLRPLGTPIGSLILTLISFLFIVPGVARLPPVVSGIMGSQGFRIIMMSLLVWTSTKNALMSLAVGVVFSILVHFIFPNSTTIERFMPPTVVMPGCLSYKVHDLVESFGNKTQDLLEAMYRSGVPDNLRLTDDNAGLIATYLINNGFVLKQNTPCNAPE